MAMETKTPMVTVALARNPTTIEFNYSKNKNNTF
jgi:hypothetical protein